MRPKIIVKMEFNVIGMSCNASLKSNKIPTLWSEFMSRLGEIKNRIYPNSTLITFGVCEHSPDCPTSGSSLDTEFHYLACVEVSSLDYVPQGMAGRTIPSTRYAVFTHKGPLDRLGATYKYIYGTWLPKSGFQLAEADDFEVYDERFKGRYNENSQIDIYIPLKVAITPI